MRRLRMFLVLVVLLAGAVVHAQEETQLPGETEEDYLRRIRCPGFTRCHTTCSENYDDALDSCEYLDYVGFGTFCRVHAARSFQDCSNGCIIECESAGGIF